MMPFGTRVETGSRRGLHGKPLNDEMEDREDVAGVVPEQDHSADSMTNSNRITSTLVLKRTGK